MRKSFLIQPYLVGSKSSKSLAVVIPSEIVKENKIDTSTVFALKCIKTGILFSYVSIDKNDNELIPVDQSYHAQSTGIIVREDKLSIQDSHQSYSNNITDNAVQEYKVCAGKGCNKVGIHNLMIIYINKKGYFCDTCKTELEKCGLVNNPKLNSVGEINGKSF